MQGPKGAPRKLNIEIPENVADGVYANLVLIAHNQSEIVLDFARIMPNTPKTKIQSRIVMNPFNAKRLLRTLEDNINKFESQFGEIKLDEKGKSKEIGFSMEE